MAMVAAGLRHDPTITPAKVAEYGTQNQYVDEENNTYWAFMQEAGKNWGLSCYSGFLSEEELSAELSAGHPEYGARVFYTERPFYCYDRI